MRIHIYTKKPPATYKIYECMQTPIHTHVYTTKTHTNISVYTYTYLYRPSISKATLIKEKVKYEPKNVTN